MTRTFDRLVSFDERSRNYNVRRVLDTTTPRSYTWSVPVRLDQGSEGACVGFGWTHEAAAKPVPITGVNDNTAYEIYRSALTLDEWPGENYEGTSVIAGAKAAQRAGWIGEYRWAFSVQDALVAISRKGPAVIGVDWREGMWDTDAKGFIHATGPQLGGHCTLVNGVNVPGRYVTITNSWGPSWGVNGTCKLSWDDFADLLSFDGECCIPTVRLRP